MTEVTTCVNNCDEFTLLGQFKGCPLDDQDHHFVWMIVKGSLCKVDATVGTTLLNGREGITMLRQPNMTPLEIEFAHTPHVYKQKIKRGL